MTPPNSQLDRLAELYGVMPVYEDVRQRWHHASEKSLLHVLRALGAEVAGIADVPAAIDARRRQLVDRGVEPVLVAWDGAATAFGLTLPPEASGESIVCRLTREDGQTLPVDIEPAQRSDTGETHRGRTPAGLPRGYHRLTIDTATRTYESLVISAPTRVYAPTQQGAGNRWGCFLPLYALRTARNWGVGDFTDLADFSDWIRSFGGRVAGTLPMLAAYLDEPFEPSPYAPASRLFWNELFVDVERVPEFADCQIAQQQVASDEVQQTLATLRAADHVQYREVMSVKRSVLEKLAADFFRRRPPRWAEFEAFLAQRPHVRDYAAFRAAYERRRQWWGQWPTEMRAGRLAAADYDSHVADYHSYVQWVAEQQLRDLAESATSAGDGLYLDLPLGVRADGYDVWRNRQCYVAHTSAGAPPDAVFTKGQDWGFAPLHPERIREDGYRHVREFLATHMRYASTLRIDHVMGLYRLFWIPHGMSGAEGVYVRYPTDELFAVLSVESHRHRTAIIGEDLGTVPQEVTAAMQRHRVRRMFVVQYELQSDHTDLLPPVPGDCIAALNTHDMPAFAAWWRGDDIPDRLALGLLTPDEAERERHERTNTTVTLAAWLQRAGWLATDTTASDARAVLSAFLNHLSASPAKIVLANLEDLWSEMLPQNVPGTHLERPNWRRKARHSFEEFRQMPDVVATLRAVDRLRRQSAPQSGPSHAPTSTATNTN